MDMSLLPGADDLRFRDNVSVCDGGVKQHWDSRGGELTYRAAAAALKRPLLTATRALDDDTNDDGAADAADADAAAACTLLQINRRGQVHAVRSL